MIKIRVSSKGQVVIPIEVREHFGIDTGTELELREGDGYISLHPLSSDPIAAARGWLRPISPSKSLLRELLREKQATATRDKARGRGVSKDQDQATANVPPAPTLFDPSPR